MSDRCPRCEREGTLRKYDCPIDGLGKGRYCVVCGWTHMDATDAPWAARWAALVAAAKGAPGDKGDE